MDITLALFLFGVVFSILCSLTTTNQPKTSTFQLPIEQQLKEVFEAIDEKETEQLPETKVVQKPPSKPLRSIKTAPVQKTTKQEIPPQIDFTKINLKQARKIAKTLGITQTVKGQAKPKLLLIKQIKQKLNKNNITAISQLLTA